MTPIELLWSVPFGRMGGVSPLARRGGLSLRRAIEAAVLPGLQRPPCLVTFSGGRDSSTVLAIATSVARREGLPLPIPVTNAFPHVAESMETDWQRLVIDAVGPPDWQRIELDDELDVLGTRATDVALRHGVLAPFNAHFLEPIIELGRGGSVLTGVGGDELFAPVGRHHLARTLAGRRRLRPLELPRLVASTAMPISVRRRRLGRRDMLSYPWLTATGHAALNAGLRAWDAHESWRWDYATRTHMWAGRRLQMHARSTALLGMDHDALVINPFMDPVVLAAASDAWGWAGPRNRTTELRALVRSDLPDAVLARATKSTFNATFWTGYGRQFADAWSGRGLDTNLVDEEALRREWSRPQPDAHSFSLLLTAWLADHATRGT